MTALQKQAEELGVSLTNEKQVANLYFNSDNEVDLEKWQKSIAEVIRLYGPKCRLAFDYDYDGRAESLYLETDIPKSDVELAADIERRQKYDAKRQEQDRLLYEELKKKFEQHF